MNNLEINNFDSYKCHLTNVLPFWNGIKWSRFIITLFKILHLFWDEVNSFVPIFARITLLLWRRYFTFSFSGRLILSNWSRNKITKVILPLCLLDHCGLWRLLKWSLWLSVNNIVSIHLYLYILRWS